MKSIFFKRVPEVYQIEMTECGAASLCMILGYYGRFEELSTVRKKCKVSRDGSKLSMMMVAAKEYGFDCNFRRIFFNYEEIEVPAIIFWDYNHFMVLEKVGKKWVYVCDPNIGRRKLTIDEFLKKFTGYVLELKPNESFVKKGKQYKSIDLIKNMLLERKDAIIYLSIIILILNLINILVPLFASAFIDGRLERQSTRNINFYFLMFFVVISFQFIIILIKDRVCIKFEQKESASLLKSIINKILKLPVSFFNSRPISSFVARIDSVNDFAEFVSVKAIPTIIGLVFSVFYMIFLFYYNYVVAIAAISVTIVILIIFYILLQCSKKTAIKGINEQLMFYEKVTQTIKLFDTIKSTAQEDRQMLDVINKYNDFENINQQTKKYTSMVQVVPIVVPNIYYLIIFSICLYLAINNKITDGKFIACHSIAVSMFTPIANFLIQFITIQSYEASARSIHDIETEDEDPLVCSKKIIDTDEKLKGDIELKNITFGYNESIPPILNDINIKLCAGKSLAIVGASGSGKSTILKLLEGTYISQKGSVLYDGVSIFDIPRNKILNSIAVVSQVPSLYLGTVRDNISMFNKSIPMDEIEKVSKEVCIFDEIMSHKDGFNSIINPNSHEFSGGQIQRIMIARALLKNPTILVLEEATSALDTIIEQEIMTNIKKRHVTIINVAHRLSTIRDCDEIVVLDKGTIVEKGTHDSMIKNGNGYYMNLILSEEYIK